jgi:hypothetical protein
MSANVESVATIPELKSAISINFIDDTMFVSTAAGIFSYDVSDPASPQLLGSLPMYIWENEDVDVDPKRKRLFISRDPRGFTTPASPGSAFPVGAVHIIDVSDPSFLKQDGFFTVPAGHTTTCVNACDFVWTAGPYKNEQTQPADWVGRPIYATDVTDPANPKPCPDPIATGHNDGVTDYVHDVQVDSRGVAWVSGAGGVRGYWTAGSHRNPVTGAVETATACKPIPYAGSGTPESATPSRFMHNAFRAPDGPGVPGSRTAEAPAAPAGPAPVIGAPQAGAPASKTRAAKSKKVAKTCSAAKPKKRATKKKRRAVKAHAAAAPKRKPRKRSAARRGKCSTKVTRPRTVKKVRARAAVADDGIAAERILYGTEENITDDCAQSGRFVTYDLAGTFDGEGFKDTAKTKHRMRVLDTWTPDKAEGSTGCASAHYFSSRGDGMFANAFYEQGVRFLDVSDPRDIRQVGWWRPANANTWAAYWHKGHVFVADFTLGVSVLKLSGGTKTVKAPALRGAATRRMDPSLGYLCPLKLP